MKLNTLLLILFLPFALAAAPSPFTDSDVEHTLSRLDKELKHRQRYMDIRQGGIDSVRLERLRMPVNSPEWFDATLDIAVRYGTYNNDSSLAYLETGARAARTMGDQRRLDDFRMQHAVALARGGMVNDALAERELVDSTRLSPHQLAAFYSLGRQMFSYISNHYEGRPEKLDYWRNRQVLAQRDLLPLLEPSSLAYRRNLGEYLSSVREYTKAEETLTALIANLPPDNSEYAIACHVLADIANVHGNHNAYLIYLAQSAISDLLRANCEVTSLQELGGALFEAGDTHRAHEYLTVAMANAVDSRASARMVRTTQLLNIVEQDHLMQVSRYETIATIVIICLGVMMILFAALVWYLRKQLNHVNALRERLQEASHTKDIYISQFMTLCSGYMDRLRDFSKLVNRKISAGHADELLSLTQSGKFVDEQSRTFYEAFDDAFLHIYPDFVAQVNTLLRPDGQITASPETGRLTPALRILAFMRLGIDDAGRIARALNLSVNTVYAYRNRLRNRAIDRDTFESSVMAIRGL